MEHDELRTGLLSGDYLKGFADGQAVMRPGATTEPHEAMAKPLYIFWSNCGENIRLWTRDLGRAEAFSAEIGKKYTSFCPSK